MKLTFSRQILEKYSNIKFHENMSSRSRIVSCGQTDMTKLMVAFRNFANAPKNWHKFVKYLEYLFIDSHLQISIPCPTQTSFWQHLVKTKVCLWRIQQFECVTHLSCIIKFVSVKSQMRSRVHGGGHLPLVVLLSAVSRVPNRCEAAVPVSPRSALPAFCCHQPEHTTWPQLTVIPAAAFVSWPTRSTLNSHLLAHISTSGDIRPYRSWIEVLVLLVFSQCYTRYYWSTTVRIERRIFWVVTPCLSVDPSVIPSPWWWRHYFLLKCTDLQGRVTTS